MLLTSCFNLFFTFCILICVCSLQELNEEGATGTRDYGFEPYIKDSTGAVVDHCVAIQNTRLSLCHCLYLSCLIAPLSTSLTTFSELSILFFAPIRLTEQEI